MFFCHFFPFCLSCFFFSFSLHFHFLSTSETDLPISAIYFHPQRGAVMAPFGNRSRTEELTSEGQVVHGPNRDEDRKKREKNTSANRAEIIVRASGGATERARMAVSVRRSLPISSLHFNPSPCLFFSFLFQTTCLRLFTHSFSIFIILYYILLYYIY